MLTTAQLTPLQRDALSAAFQSPAHALVRTRGGYMAQHGRVSTSGLKQVRLFTPRLLNMLERAYLVEFDQPQWPNTATLTRVGIALAEQLRAAEQAKAVRS